ncbi:MAG: alkylmercury lyase family protein [Gammaproteobacteria bacterium]|nr:alkylmercury lyase family protein [Gammaproteobacteria bacterium]
MNTKVNTALKRLDSILPLLSGLQSLSSDEAALYCKLLNSYIKKGRTLTRDEVAGLVDNAEQALANIVDSKLIVLDADGNPFGAYPFTSEEREYKVHVNGVTAHCMCALDALSVSLMFDIPTVIDSECRVTGEKIHLEQNGSDFSGGTLDAWFGINWGAAATDTACAASLCMEMMFLKNEAVAREWLDESPDTREIFDLPSAVAFAAGFFVPLAENCQQAA